MESNGTVRGRSEQRIAYGRKCMVNAIDRRWVGWQTEPRPASRAEGWARDVTSRRATRSSVRERTVQHSAGGSNARRVGAHCSAERRQSVEASRRAHCLSTAQSVALPQSSNGPLLRGVIPNSRVVSGYGRP